jgi:hypothetical protein
VVYHEGSHQLAQCCTDPQRIHGNLRIDHAAVKRQHHDRYSVMAHTAAMLRSPGPDAPQQCIAAWPSYNA